MTTLSETSGISVGQEDRPLNVSSLQEAAKEAELQDLTQTEDAGESGLESPGEFESAQLPDEGHFPPQLWQVIRERLDILLGLEDLEQERQRILRTPDLPRDASEELNRQCREMRRFPTAQETLAAIEQLKKRLALMQEKGGQGDVPVPSPQYLQAAEMAQSQWDTIIAREGTAIQVLRTCIELVAEEPLFVLFKQHAVNAEAVFGWAVYGIAMQSLKRRVMAMPEGRADLVAITRDLAAAEAPMVQEFWKLYEEAAELLVSGKVDRQAQAPLRAFLRYGMIGGAPWFLSSEVAEHILNECQHPLEKWDSTTQATHVLYADEYIEFAAKACITPSIDEDLELNHVGSPEWRKDRCWRKAIAARIRIAGLNEVARDLHGKCSAVEQENERITKQLTQMPRQPAAEYQAARRRTLEQIQDNKVSMARLSLATEHILGKLIPAEQQRSQDAVEKLKAAGGRIPASEIARKEAGQIHRICRLVAKLKDPFMPFTLRESFRLGIGAVNDRQTIIDRLKDVEKSIPTIFSEVAVYAKMESRRTYVRYGPYVLLAPACGFMSLSWNPRGGSEVGRLVLPGYCARPGIIDGVLGNLLADFCWDTSRESAGIDLLTSDTLVASYGKIRWDYRKRPKDAREKAGIYNDENDRVNWRRHFSLYLASAMEAGKRLFFKCPELYESVVKYLPLPEGVEKLSRS